MASAALMWLCLLIAIVCLVVITASRRASQSQKVSVHIGLPDTPNHATKTDIALLAFRAASKHALAFLRCAPALKADPIRPQTFELTSIYMQGTLHFNSHDELLYRQAVNNPASDEIISPMFLVALTLPLVVHLLADRACAVLPLGAVNTRNCFKVHDIRLSRDINSLRKLSSQSRISYRASFGGHDRPGHRRKRGMEFCISIIVLVDERPILTQELWFLQFLPKSLEPRYTPPGDQSDQGPNLAGPKAAYPHSLEIGVRDPSKWAAASKDYNPIHVSSIGAKIFGFKSVIAHGNHVVALALEQLRKGDSVEQGVDSSMAGRMWWKDSQSLTLDVQFIRPMLLPAIAQIVWERATKDDSNVNFAVSSRGKACIAGTLRHGVEQVL